MFATVSTRGAQAALVLKGDRIVPRDVFNLTQKRAGRHDSKAGVTKAKITFLFLWHELIAFQRLYS